MGTFTDISQLFAAGYGWVFVLCLVLYELYAPKLLERDTALAPIVRDVPEKVESIEREQESLKGDMDDVQDHVQEVQERQKATMQVQRAQARANPQMDHGRVDEYLWRNGVGPDEFLHGDEVEGYGNWEDERREDGDDQ